jgi:beta-mannosidase
MAWPDPGLHVDVRRAGTGYAIDVQATRFARAVWIDAGDAELSDNALTLLPGERVTVHATSAAGLAALRTSLRVRSLADAPAFTKSR